MDRRDFLISAGLVAAFSAIPFLRRLSPPRPLTIINAYSLWYNRPAVAELDGGFCVGYVTSSGEVSVAEISEDLLVRRTARLYKYSDASDHGSPSIIRVPSGRYMGHLLACFSNHASPMFCARSKNPNDAWCWGEAHVIESGRATYNSLVSLPDDRILLMYTLQERIGPYSTGEWRRVVSRWSDDGGDSWSSPVVIAGFGAGTFPYSTPLSVAKDGRCAMAYAVYSSSVKKHRGLTVVVTDDAFVTKAEYKIDLGLDADLDTIPYETRWTPEGRVVVSYTEMSSDGARGMSRVVTIDAATGRASNIKVANSALHTYASGAAIGLDGTWAIASPVSGGLVRHDLLRGNSISILGVGQYSSPWVFSIQGNIYLMALSNPKIKTTRDFQASILIMPVPG